MSSGEIALSRDRDELFARFQEEDRKHESIKDPLDRDCYERKRRDQLAHGDLIIELGKIYLVPPPDRVDKAGKTEQSEDHSDDQELFQGESSDGFFKFIIIR